MSRQSDLARRVAETERRLEWLDQHGSRGVDAIRIQIHDQTADIEKLQGKLDNIQKSVGFRQTMVFIGLILPLYIIILGDLIRGLTNG